MSVTYKYKAANGLDVAKDPKQIVQVAAGFIKTPFTWREQGIA